MRLISVRNLYSTFITPWADQSAARSVEPEFHLPACYLSVQAPPPGPAKAAMFSDETLFFMFYSSPRDALQEVAAQELWVAWLCACASHLIELVQMESQLAISQRIASVDHERKRHGALFKGSGRHGRAGPVYLLGPRELGKGAQRDDSAICRSGGEIDACIRARSRPCPCQPGPVSTTSAWSCSSSVSAATARFLSARYGGVVTLPILHYNSLVNVYCTPFHIIHLLAFLLSVLREPCIFVYLEPDRHPAIEPLLIVSWKWHIICPLWSQYNSRPTRI